MQCTANVQYNAVLTDGYMPILTGWQATQEIREREKQSNKIGEPLIIIGVTGATSEEDLGGVEKGQSVGMTDSIAKPVGRDQLRQILSKHCSRKGPLLAPPALPPPSRFVAIDFTGAAAASATSVLSWKSEGSHPKTAASSSFDSQSSLGAEVPLPVETLVGAAKTKPRTVSARVAVVMDPTGGGQKVVLCALLSRMGLEVHTIGSDEECLELMGKMTVVIVLINDRISEDKSSRELVSAIRRGEHGSASWGPVPIVVLLPASEKNNLSAYDGIYDGALAKPFTKSNVSSVVQSCIGDDNGSAKIASAQSGGMAKSRGKEGGMPIALPVRRIRILVVEDHWANRKMLESMLSHQGHDLQCVENGLEAVKITAKQPFDLVLMDCNMPLMDGWQATAAIRERKALNANTPIIAVTANAMKGDRDKCIAAGMSDYISKPVECRRLFETIAKWTQQMDDEAGISEKEEHDAKSDMQVQAAMTASKKPARPVDWSG